ncbi:hypothetical protein AWC38_SpisGene17166 [Stylophora pistillata]|uniref:C2H2-type domain-containing protein n=1 Tax=Stylophora pistillata TaxID=50429 RepID=A0A2B4RQ52_STYPI|nr:hypothetical protein AWC38_SpisGene17166 [Stylophora pistillata]
MAFTAKILSWRFGHLNIVGCLLERRPTTGGITGTPGPLATPSQRQYLDAKFKVGQATGVKLYPVDVAREMRYARNQEGEELFIVTEFLTEQEIQSYFSRRASKLRYSHSDDPESDQDEGIMAAEKEITYENVRTVMLEEVGLRHPIVFDTFNLCDTHKAGICSECRTTLGEHVRADCQDSQLIALSESIHELSLEPSFQATCDHYHSDVCERCGTLASTLNDIEEGLVAQSQNMTSNSKEELAFRVKNAKTVILVWKLLLRSVNQDGARTLTEVTRSYSSAFTSVEERRIKASVRDPDQPVHIEEEDSNAAIFSCPEEDCVKTFVRYSSMQRHLDCGKHQRALRRYTLLDRAAVGYAQRLEGQCAAVPEQDAVAEPPSSHDMLPKGWALKSSASRRCRFTYKQKNYLTEKFQPCERSGRKSDLASVARSMMSAVDSQGKRMFSSEEFLTASQVAGFFSRLAAKESLFNADDLEEEIECATQEETIEELTNEVSREQLPGHPIMWDKYDLCEMTSEGNSTQPSYRLQN